MRVYFVSFLKRTPLLGRIASFVSIRHNNSRDAVRGTYNLRDAVNQNVHLYHVHVHQFWIRVEHSDNAPPP